MPLTAYIEGKPLFAWCFTPEQWTEFKLRDKHNRGVLICGALAVPKTSPLAYQFFAHHPGSLSGCPGHSGENAEHLFLKQELAHAAQRSGWTAQIEERQEDGKWVSDVLVRKDERVVALEAQISKQTTQDFVRRTQQYARSGIDVVWFYNDYLYQVQYDSLLAEYETSGLTIIPLRVNTKTGSTVTDFVSPDPLLLEEAFSKFVDRALVPGTPSAPISAFQIVSQPARCNACSNQFSTWSINCIKQSLPCNCEIWSVYTRSPRSRVQLELLLQETQKLPTGISQYRWERVYNKRTRERFEKLVQGCPNCINSEVHKAGFSIDSQAETKHIFLREFAALDWERSKPHFCPNTPRVFSPKHVIAQDKSDTQKRRALFTDKEIASAQRKARSGTHAPITH